MDVRGCCDPHHEIPCRAIGQSGNDPTMPEPTFEELIRP